ncbi:MAG: putative subtilase-family protease, partial [Pseudonocardiales bacterium]|nr:putative subtilase-family protease [Pseudonocardiales bacterium]
MLTFSLATVAEAAPAGHAVAPGGLSAKAADQIAALQQIKQSLSPAERKLDSRLAVTAREQTNQATTKATPRVQTGVTVSKSNTTTVDVAVMAVTSDLLNRLRGVGATVAYASSRLKTIRAAVPVSGLGTVASWTDVVKVRVATGAMTAHEAGPAAAPVKTESKAAKAARLDAQLKAAIATGATATSQGAVVSEGDKADAADKARAKTKVTGVGVKVCVLSDGVDSLAASTAAGELPAVDVLSGQEGSGDEGTAMLEIVHDLAPNAALGFATAFTGDASFADNIRALRFDAHCDVIVDDVIYFNEDPFQDGPIAQSVNAVTADGARYFSSAGNEGNTIDGTAGNFEGDFVGSGRSVGKFAGTAHDFDPGAGVQVFEPLSDASSAGVPVTLFWADPLGAAADDYDLYLFDAANNVVSFSQDVQDGTQEPFEILQTPLFGGSGLRLAVVKFSGADRYFQLSALRGRFSNSADGLVAHVTPGVTRGHSAAVNAFSIAAAPAATALPFDLEPGDPANPTGPYPNPFTKAQQPERFTSDGPRRVFFNADGMPITPGNFSASGGTVRQKPDVTAADGVSTSVDGFAPFFGTSAAAPHAAAIAALVLSGNPGATTADIREAFNA